MMRWQWFRVPAIAFLVFVSIFQLGGGQALDLSPASHQVTHFCGQVCKFRLCENGRKKPLLLGAYVQLKPPGNVSAPWVCLPGSKLGAIHGTGEPKVRQVRDIRNNIPISTYQQEGLSPPFSRSYFSLAEINRGPRFPGKYGILREESNGTQDDFLDQLCVQIPITKYDLHNEDGSLLTTVTTEEKLDCLGFTVQVPQILIELTWDTNDDLDLSLREPDGEVIKYNAKTSGTGGRLLHDSSSTNCTKRDSGKEQIVYNPLDRPLSGMYEVEVRHFSSCPENKSTSWFLSIYVNGKLLFKTRNTSFPGPKNQLIRKRLFRFPPRNLSAEDEGLG